MLEVSQTTGSRAGDLPRNYDILKALRLALSTGDSFGVILRTGGEKKRVRWDCIF